MTTIHTSGTDRTAAVDGGDFDERDLDERHPLDTTAADDQDLDDELVLELVVLDLAGTTVADDGIVEEAFRIAAAAIGLGDEDAFDDDEDDDEDEDDADDDSDDVEDRAREDDDEYDEDEDDADDDEHTSVDRFDGGTGIDDALDYVRRTMGQSKIDVFRVLTGGDEERAQAGNAAFEAAYAQLITDGRIEEIPGAGDTIRLLRELGVTVVLTTGFAPETRDALLASLGWTDIADLVLSPSDAGRGRPAPDLPLTALIRTGTSSVDTMVVVGDTASDILSGINAGAALVVGVLTGAHDEHTLFEAGADDVISSIAELPALLGLD